jgi:ribonuclease HI
VNAVLRTDGASRGNPGPAAIGVVLEDSAGRVLRELGERIGTATNNVAEYRALLRGLEEAAALGVKSLDVRLDSELLVHQIRGTYRVRNAVLAPLHADVVRRLRAFERVAVSAVPRGENRRPDALANWALDASAAAPHAARPAPDAADAPADGGKGRADALASLALAGDVPAVRDALRGTSPAVLRDAVLRVAERSRAAGRELGVPPKPGAKP